MASDRSWKDHVLRSGVPLEYAVRRLFKDQGLSVEDCVYERVKEDGLPAVFSIDARAVDQPADGAVGRHLEFFVECKWRHRGVRWLFMPPSRGLAVHDDIGFPDQDPFIILDALSSVEVRPTESFDDVECARGVEILTDKFNPNAVERALSQLGFALGAAMGETIRSQVQIAADAAVPAVVMVPVLVTTAELWRLKEGTTPDAVEGASEIDEIADEFEQMIVCSDPSPQLVRYTTDSMQLTGKAHRAAVARFRDDLSVGWQSWVDWTAKWHPSRFMVVRYRALDALVKRVRNAFPIPD